jgi:rhodanese-related sulfurtransferase
VVDVRTPEEVEGGAYPGAVNIPLDELTDRLDELGNNPGREIVVYCASGARSAYAQRTLTQLGYSNVKNGGGIAAMMSSLKPKPSAAPSNQPMVVDVRTVEEFQQGAYPGAVNIPLDELQMRVIELGDRSREITLYCASGARSAYAQRGLQQMGFTNVRNGGGIMQMMRG